MTKAAQLGATAAPLVGLTVAGLYPAIINGFPLLFTDSGVYLGDFRYPGVPPFYTLFVWITSLKAYPWLTIVAQSAITAITLTIFLRAAGGIARPGPLFAAGLMVLAFNQAPWLASWIMPDIFTGLGVAALCALLLTPERLHWAEGTWLAGLVGFATLTTTANGPLFVGLIATCLFLRGAVMRRNPHLAGTFAGAGMVVLAAVTTMAANKALHGVFALNSAGPALSFSRLADTGLAQPYLADRCRTAEFRVCAHLDALNDFKREEQTFLFHGVADLTDARGAGHEEYSNMVAEILAERWPEFLLEGLRDAVRLFGRPTIGDVRYFELVPMSGARSPDAWIADNYPRAYPSFLDARQQRDELLPLFPKSTFSVSTYFGYAVLGALILFAWSNGDSVGAVVGLAALAAVTGELVLHGMLVGAFPRYHVKVAWLGWLFAVALAARSTKVEATTKTAIKRVE